MAEIALKLPTRYHLSMGRGTRAERATRNVVELRRARASVSDPEARDGVDRVVEDLRQDAGPVLAKSAAARLLGVSRNTLDKWIARGMVPTRDGGVDRAALEEIAAEVEVVRRLAESKPGVLAEALSRLAERDPEFADLEEQAEQGLRAVEKGKLVPLRIPEGFGPDD